VPAGDRAHPTVSVNQLTRDLILSVQERYHDHVIIPSRNMAALRNATVISIDGVILAAAIWRTNRAFGLPAIV
jgi:hypothetical protein